MQLAYCKEANFGLYCNQTNEEYPLKENIMKTYKDFEKSYIGSSDIAAILVSGPSGDGLHAEYISFGEDGAYSAYIVTNPDAEIGSH